jgi:hypothetical protein
MAVAVASSSRLDEAGSEQFDRLVQALIDAWGRVEDLRAEGAPLRSLVPALVLLDEARAVLRPHREGGSPAGGNADASTPDKPRRR